jgi:hypothetical protein
MVRLPWAALNDKRMDLALQTWLLRPTSIPSSLWYLSSFRGEVYVRAKGPMEARWLAAEKFCKYPKGNMNAAPPSSPWLDPDVVYCVRSSDKRFSGIQEPCVIAEQQV